MLTIERIYLEDANSVFRFNVDGYPGKEIENIEILPKDSLWVFVEVTVNPNSGNSPLVISDRMVFESQGNQKTIELEAWGQDAHYIRPQVFSQNLPPYSVIPKDTTWTNLKPIVIFGYAVVDSANSLTIQEGTRIHFHSDAGMWIFQGADFQVNGTAENPVTFQGDRLEGAYANTPGQWDRIWINEGVKDITINHAIIKNGLIGLQIDLLPTLDNLLAPTSPRKVIIKNTRIENHSGLGILTQNSQIIAENLLVANCGQYAIGITGSGNYSFNHTTIANFWNLSTRKTPSVYGANAYEDLEGNLQVRQLENISFTNSIITGANETEADFEFRDEAPADFSLNYCLVKREEPYTGRGFQGMIYNEAAGFIDVNASNFGLTASSICIDAGTSTNVTTDLNGNPRNTPDLGAIEFVPE